MGNDDNPYAETGIWNVGQGYSFDVTMYHLYWIDRFESMAEFGAVDINEDLNLSDQEKIVTKIKAIRWFYSHLKQLISGSKFVFKDRKDLAQQMTDAENNLAAIGKCLPAIETKHINQKENTYSISIHEELFNVCYSGLGKIKEDILPILYQGNLIFNYREAVNPQKMKQEYMERMKTRA